jgi:hypothetical protein
MIKDVLQKGDRTSRLCEGCLASADLHRSARSRVSFIEEKRRTGRENSTNAASIYRNCSSVFLHLDSNLHPMRDIFCF